MKVKKIQGYTLIELIVVIALLTGLTTIMLLNSTNSRDTAKLDKAARQLESALTQAQAYGNSGRSFPSDPPDPEKDFDKGYGVFVSKVTNPNTIIIYGGLGDDEGTGFEEDEMKYMSSAQEFETITFEGGVTVSKIKGTNSAQNADDGHVLFRRGWIGANTYTNNQTVNGLDITLESGTLTKVVTVYNTGLIYINK